MGFTLPTYNTGGNAPEVEDGLALWRFDDLVLKAHPDWATESDKFGKPDDGQRYHFIGTLVDEDGAVIYDPNSEGDPIELEAVTRTATGEKSNFFAMMSGLLTAKELAAYQAATPDDPFDGSALPGRVYNIKVGHSSKKWPLVEQIIGIAKNVKAK
jgi:hypothetical protein